MVENGALQSSQLLRDLDHALAPDFQTAGSARARVTEFKVPDTPTINMADTQRRERSTPKTDTLQNLKTTKKQPTQEPLDHIANLVLGLRYGQMIELCNAMWKSRPEYSSVTQEKLPSLLHGWAMSRSKKASPSL
jgi:hypothetical protein